MNKSKEERIETIQECLNTVAEISRFYGKESPVQILLEAAYNNINSVGFLEVHGFFDINSFKFFNKKAEEDNTNAK